MNNVTVVGSINIDLTSYLTRWPKIGETIKAKQTQISLGGKGANQAVTASRLGSKVTMIGAVGSDSFGMEVEQGLKQHEISLRLSKPKDCNTGMAFIDVGPDGNNIIRISSGANGMICPSKITESAALLTGSAVVLLQNEIPFDASLKAAQIVKEAGTLVIMDPAPAPMPFWTSSQLEAFDILTPNAHEAEMITGRKPRNLTEAKEVAEALKAYGVKGSIITLGSMGVAWSIDGNSGVLPAMQVDSIDTVGAGDCFNGAFAAAIANGKKLESAIEFATIAAALSTTRKGAVSSIPSLEEVQRAIVVA